MLKIEVSKDEGKMAQIVEASGNAGDILCELCAVSASILNRLPNPKKAFVALMLAIHNEIETEE